MIRKMQEAQAQQMSYSTHLIMLIAVRGMILASILQRGIIPANFKQSSFL